MSLLAVKGATAWLCQHGHGLGFRKALVGTLWAVSLLLYTIGLRKQSSHLVRPPFLALKVFGVWIGVC